MPSVPFYQADRGRCRDPVRDRVAQHLLAHHPPGPITLLCLPGADWRAERRLRRLTPQRLRVVGVERDPAIHAAASACRPRQAELHHQELSTYLAQPPQQQFTAVWLDLCSTLNAELRIALRLLPRWLSGQAVPFAITFQPHRDATSFALPLFPPAGSAAQKRAAVLGTLLAAQRPVSHLHVLKYKSSQHMAVLLGTFKPCCEEFLS